MSKCGSIICSNQKVTLCGECKVASFCSKECKDFISHDKFCKQISAEYSRINPAVIKIATLTCKNIDFIPTPILVLFDLMEDGSEKRSPFKYAAVIDCIQVAMELSTYPPEWTNTINEILGMLFTGLVEQSKMTEQYIKQNRLFGLEVGLLMNTENIKSKIFNSVKMSHYQRNIISARVK